MTLNSLFRAVDAVIAFRDAAKRFKVPADGRVAANDTMSQSVAAQGIAGQIETRLTNVVVAALKEAFDRDHARLELERAQLEEERRRAEEAMRLEIRRQSVERELTRLRLLAGTALVGWITSLILVGLHAATASMASRLALGAGWLLLLGALAAAFAAQGRVNLGVQDRKEPVASPAAPLWLLVAGLGSTAISLLL